MFKRRHLTCGLSLLVLAACSEAPPPDAETLTATERPSPAEPAARALQPAPAQGDTAPGSVREIEWDALIPDDYQPDKLLSEYPLDDITDDDPRAAELMEKLRALWDQAPVREDLDGTAVKLAEE